MRLKSLLMSVATLVSLSTSAVAETITLGDQARLKARGFTQSDFEVFSSTQIAPAYFFFTEWYTCNKEVSELAILQTGTVSQAEAIMIESCASRASALEAVLSRSTGLAKAAQAMSVGKALAHEYIAARFREKHIDDGDRIDDVDLWTIGKPQPNGCKSALRLKDFLINVVKFHGSPVWTITALALYSGGRLAKEDRSKFQSLVVLESSNGSKAIGPLSISAAAGNDRAIYEFELKILDIEEMSQSSLFSIEGVKGVKFDIPSFARMLEKLDACAR